MNDVPSFPFRDGPSPARAASEPPNQPNPPNLPGSQPTLPEGQTVEDSVPSIGATEGTLFGDTQWSLVRGAGAEDSPGTALALDHLCRTYWPAVYALTRRYGHPPEDARDLTQAFFARLIERRWVTRADPGKGRFRTFLVTALKRFLADETDRAHALKRGGGCTIVSVDVAAEEEWYGLEPRDDRSPDWLFDRRWAQSVMHAALDRLREEQARAGGAALFQALVDYLDGATADATLAATGARFGLGSSAIKMRLLRLRERFREFLRAEVAETLSDRTHLDEELGHLLAALR